jgi:hypothetical protein
MPAHGSGRFAHCEDMKNIVLVLAVVLAVAVGAPKRAEACGGGGGDYDGLIAAALVVGGTYVGVTGTMAIKDIASDDHSMGYGIAEAVIHTPIALAWAGAAWQDSHSEYGSNNPTGFLIMTGLHTALAAHGIYTIVKKAREPKKERGGQQPRRYQGPPGMISVGRVSATVAPTPMQNGAGLGFAGSF